MLFSLLQNPELAAVAESVCLVCLRKGCRPGVIGVEVVGPCIICSEIPGDAGNTRKRRLGKLLCKFTRNPEFGWVIAGPIVGDKLFPPVQGVVHGKNAAVVQRPNVIQADALCVADAIGAAGDVAEVVAGELRQVAPVHRHEAVLRVVPVLINAGGNDREGILARRRRDEILRVARSPIARRVGQGNEGKNVFGDVVDRRRRHDVSVILRAISLRVDLTRVVDVDGVTDAFAVHQLRCERLAEVALALKRSRHGESRRQWIGVDALVVADKEKRMSRSVVDLRYPDRATKGAAELVEVNGRRLQANQVVLVEVRIEKVVLVVL